MASRLRHGGLWLAVLLFAGCASLDGEQDTAPRRPPDLTSIPDAVPRTEPRSARGNPPFYEVAGRRYYVKDSAAGYLERGVASWYGTKFHGRSTSSGEPYDMYAMTAAHKTLPLPTYVRVTHLGNGRSVVVRVNDRGPFVGERIIDLSYAAAVRLGMHHDGTALVQVEALNPGAPGAASGAVTVASTGPTQELPRDFWLQAGAFSEPGNARRLADRISAAGIPNVAVKQAEQASPPLYRVRVGPYQDAETVEQMLVRLRALDIRDVHLADY
ncbi:MAG: septal ring lytic transglycosylase RlpA family protein [Gammaproteobacteria bacterium]